MRRTRQVVERSKEERWKEKWNVGSVNGSKEERKQGRGVIKKEREAEMEEKDGGREEGDRGDRRHGR